MDVLSKLTNLVSNSYTGFLPMKSYIFLPQAKIRRSCLSTSANSEMLRNRKYELEILVNKLTYVCSSVALSHSERIRSDLNAADSELFCRAVNVSF